MRGTVAKRLHRLAVRLCPEEQPYEMDNNGAYRCGETGTRRAYQNLKKRYRGDSRCA